MGTGRTAWHFYFGVLLRECAPRWIEVRTEVPVASESQRADFLLLRRTAAPDPADPGATLRGLAWQDLGGGYGQLTGGAFATYVVELDGVAAREHDDLLPLFGHAAVRTRDAQRWWGRKVGSKEGAMKVEELEGYDEVRAKLYESLPVALRLAGLSPEQRLAGLSPEERLLALPDEALRALSETYVATLPAATRDAIRRRLGR